MSVVKVKLNEDGSVKFKIPPKPQWKMSFSINSEFCIYVVTAPNAFYRWIQKIVLGITWVKL